MNKEKMLSDEKVKDVSGGRRFNRFRPGGRYFEDCPYCNEFHWMQCTGSYEDFEAYEFKCTNVGKIFERKYLPDDDYIFLRNLSPIREVERKEYNPTGYMDY